MQAVLILLGREAAHSRRCVTPAVMPRAMKSNAAGRREARRRSGIEVWEHASAIDLIVDEEPRYRCVH
ncbi:MAG: hypothetical protein R2845_11610 [Thermomicrobiales bacterium]